MKRGAPERRPMRRSYRYTGPSASVVDAVLERAQYSCELCGVGLGPRRVTDWLIHHRRPRRMGGSQLRDTNLPPNLLLLDPSCHDRIEKERSAGYAGGWLVRQEELPAESPVFIHGYRWVELTVDGRYVDVDAPEGA